MLRHALVAIVTFLALAACRSGRPSEPVPPNADPVVGTDAGQEVGGPGTICSLGQVSLGSGRVAHECNPGLSCCYPCGMEGCDSVCMEDCGPPRP